VTNFKYVKIINLVVIAKLYGQNFKKFKNNSLIKILLPRISIIFKKTLIFILNLGLKTKLIVNYTYMWSAGERREKETNEVNFMRMRNEKGSSNII
jgi:hypothetical protein